MKCVVIQDTRKLRPKENKEANLGILEHFSNKNLGILEFYVICANKRKKSIDKDKYIEEQNTGFFIDSF